MKPTKLRGKELAALGLEDTTLRSFALQLLKKHCRRMPKTEQLELIAALVQDPEAYVKHAFWGPLAMKLRPRNSPKTTKSAKPCQIYGAAGIEDSAKAQLHQALQLPISTQGALMPDAHHGYGLPIGGVLATENAVIPYGVGVDIGCRMCLSVFRAPDDYLQTQHKHLSKLLKEHTRFGKKTFDDDQREDPLFDNPVFNSFGLLRRLKDKAFQQIGSSGGGNHFVEFGQFSLQQEQAALNLPAGNYLALLSHSGSRGLGAQIAQTYTEIAMKKRQLPKADAHLAWLYLNEQAGQEYWMAMNLAGDYATACHQHIHKRLQQALGFDTLLQIDNHHNFAWKEQLEDGTPVIVHRKGATPAHKGTLGIIPGSMTAPAFIVQGLGHAPALNSAAHGAGRRYSRTKAKKMFNKNMLQEVLDQKQVTLIGADLDEAPFAYKDIHEVMRAQEDLVEILGAFYPKIVRMDQGKR